MFLRCSVILTIRCFHTVFRWLRVLVPWFRFLFVIFAFVMNEMRELVIFCYFLTFTIVLILSTIPQLLLIIILPFTVAAIGQTLYIIIFHLCR